MKQLDRLLFLQGQRCYFCRLPIPEGEASVEHLVASSNGGGNEDDNCVVCCKAVNAVLGNLSIKAKLQAVLNQQGHFSCPRAAQFSPSIPAQPDEERLATVVADLQKRGSARPRKVATLLNTIATVFQKKLSEGDVSGLLARLVARGYIVINESRVTYALQQDAG